MLMNTAQQQIHHLSIMLLCAIFFIVVPVCKGEFGMEVTIETNITCGEKLALDAAEIRYLSDDANIHLYATNKDCYECAMSFVAATQTADECSMLWVPNGWHLYFVSSGTGQQTGPSIDYTFGEHGRYLVTYTSGTTSGTVTETEAPIDSLAPFWSLVGLLMGVAVACFVIPWVYEHLKSVPDAAPLVHFVEVYVLGNEPTNCKGGYASFSPLEQDQLGTSEGGGTPSMSNTAAVPLLMSQSHTDGGGVAATGAAAGEGSGSYRSSAGTGSFRGSGAAFGSPFVQEVDGGDAAAGSNRSNGSGSGVGGSENISALAAAAKRATSRSPMQPAASAVPSDCATAKDTVKDPKAAAAQRAKSRLCSLDTFRGIALTIMVFVNYGAGGYYFLDHAPWNGLTIADLVFPWFMFMMGVSMALSYASLAKKATTTLTTLWYKAARRSLILLSLGLFLNNGYDLETLRIPGVLQYFALSYFVTCATVLTFMRQSSGSIKEIIEQEKIEAEKASNWSVHPADRSWIVRLLGDSSGRMPSAVLWGYRYEWVVQALIVVLYVSISLGAKAPGCDAGYLGPGGIANNGDNADCTGGIHRYIDMQLFGYDHFYHGPTCMRIYGCIPYDPEGLLGGLTACTLTYLGLMTGRVLVHFKDHSERLSRWAIWSFILLLLAGALCGFSQNDGWMPINKNLWSTSFCCMAAGSGILGLGVCYVLIDWHQWWSGAPFRYLGMNSILIYCASDVFGEYFPFSYSTDASSHGNLLTMNVIGVASWMLVAYVCYKKNIFWKI